MNKEEFALALYDALRGLPIDDVERSIAYYREMIDERVEDGMSEEEAVAALGSVEEIARQIMAEVPISSLVREKVTGGRKSLPAWEIVLLVLGSPLWIACAAVALSVLIAVFAVLWSLVVALFAAMGGLAAGAVASIPGAVMTLLRGGVPQALLVLGAGLVCGGIAVALFLGASAAAREIARASRGLWIWVKSLFVRKEEVAE